MKLFNHLFKDSVVINDCSPPPNLLLNVLQALDILVKIE